MDCGYTWHTRPANVLHCGSGCPACACDRRAKNAFIQKTVKLGTRTVRVQGFEPFAIAWLLSHGCNPEQLRVTASEGKPTFRYTMRGKSHLYVPDLYHAGKNTVIEVKSSYTLLKNRITFERNCIKARQVIEDGYKFSLLVMDAYGNRVDIPKRWYVSQYDKLKELV
jgi:hypothetical protein